MGNIGVTKSVPVHLCILLIIIVQLQYIRGGREGGRCFHNRVWAGPQLSVPLILDQLGAD